MCAADAAIVVSAYKNSNINIAAIDFCFKWPQNNYIRIVLFSRERTRLTVTDVANDKTNRYDLWLIKQTAHMLIQTLYIFFT